MRRASSVKSKGPCRLRSSSRSGLSSTAATRQRGTQMTTRTTLTPIVMVERVQCLACQSTAAPAPAAARRQQGRGRAGAEAGSQVTGRLPAAAWLMMLGFKGCGITSATPPTIGSEKTRCRPQRHFRSPVRFLTKRCPPLPRLPSCWRRLTHARITITIRPHLPPPQPPATAPQPCPHHHLSQHRHSDHPSTGA